jgi:hypothetical protein
MYPSVNEGMITARILTLAMALFVVLAISASTVVQEVYASGGIMSLVAHGAQDVYLTGNNPLREEVPGLGGNSTTNK